MSHPESNLNLVKKAYKQTFQCLKSYPLIYVPFIIFAAFESLALMLIYLAPQMPFSIVFSPPIRTFWGEKFLHYPVNFLLLPKLASLSRMALAVILSSLLTGVATAIILDIHNKKQIKLKDSFKNALKQYISLFTIIFIFILSFYIIVKIIDKGLASYFIAGHSRLLFLKARLWLGPILSFINFMLTFLIQSCFIYAIPLLIIGKQKLIESIFGSFSLFKKFFLPTLILVGLPMLIYIPIIILEYNTAFLINKLFPEFILLVLFLGIIISALVIDPLITIAATFLYLDNKSQA